MYISAIKLVPRDRVDDCGFRDYQVTMVHNDETFHVTALDVGQLERGIEGVRKFEPPEAFDRAYAHMDLRRLVHALCMFHAGQKVKLPVSLDWEELKSGDSDPRHGG